MSEQLDGSAAVEEAVRAEKLERWTKWSTPVVIVAAVLPLTSLAGDESRTWINAGIEVACWLVFAVDLGVHMRLRPGYLRTGLGRFDLAVVVVTFPVYLLVPAWESAGFLAIARLARVVRIIMAALRGAAGLKILVARLGKAVLYAGVAMVTCALIVNRVESPADGFANIGDSLWWAIVTLTTVGYGDLVPQTTIGRLAGSFLMLAGLALLGVLASSLASFLGIQPDDEEVEAGEPSGEPGAAEGGVSSEAGDLTDEVRRLRAEVGRLAELLDERR